MSEMPRIWWSPRGNQFLTTPRSVPLVEDSQAESVPGAVELAPVEETSEATARKLVEIAEHVRDAIRHHHRYDHLDQEVINDLGESSRQLRLIAAEVARLRSAGDGAADEELA